MGGISRFSASNDPNINRSLRPSRLIFRITQTAGTQFPKLVQRIPVRIGDICLRRRFIQAGGFSVGTENF